MLAWPRGKLLLKFKLKKRNHFKFKKVKKQEKTFMFCAVYLDGCRDYNEISNSSAFSKYAKLFLH